MKRILIALAVLSLTGCEEGSTTLDKTVNQISKVPGFEDCVSFKGRIAGYTTIVVRCPNSDVMSTWQGKGQVGTLTTDSKPPSADLERARAEAEYARAKVDQAAKALNEAQIKADTAKRIYEQIK
jgi:hypothetical protein